MQTIMLLEAMAEARRFLDMAEEARDRLEHDKYASISGSKEVAAAKRASLDLTRALARMRQP